MKKGYTLIERLPGIGPAAFRARASAQEKRYQAEGDAINSLSSITHDAYAQTENLDTSKAGTLDTAYFSSVVDSLKTLKQSYSDKSLISKIQDRRLRTRLEEVVKETTQVEVVAQKAEEARTLYEQDKQIYEGVTALATAAAKDEIRKKTTPEQIREILDTYIKTFTPENVKRMRGKVDPITEASPLRGRRKKVDDAAERLKTAYEHLSRGLLEDARYSIYEAHASLIEIASNYEDVLRQSEGDSKAQSLIYSGLALRLSPNLNDMIHQLEKRKRDIPTDLRPYEKVGASLGAPATTGAGAATPTSGATPTPPIPPSPTPAVPGPTPAPTPSTPSPPTAINSTTTPTGATSNPSTDGGDAASAESFLGQEKSP